MSTQLIGIVVVLLTVVHVAYNADFTTCPRDRSRIVRKLVASELLPLYEKVDASVPLTCKYHGEYDMYLQQELQKLEETHSKWTCQYCGKAFYNERFLDNHFTNRHVQYIKQGPDIVCLSDLCDVFRCEVILHKNEPKYWDNALCREKQLAEYYGKCIGLVKQCIPESLTKMDRHIFFEKLNETLCSYLTCDKFWILPHSEAHPVSLALYIVATSMLIFGILIYYYVAYTHFYTDESLLDDPKEIRHHQHEPLIYYPPPGQEIRYRSGHREVT